VEDPSAPYYWDPRFLKIGHGVEDCSSELFNLPFWEMALLWNKKWRGCAIGLRVDATGIRDFARFSRSS
jgi:hypothetical protein